MGISKRLADTVRRAAFAATLIFAAGANATAQEISAEHLQAAKAAIKAGESTVTLDNILPNLSARMKGQLILSQPNLEQEISDIVDAAAIAMAPRRGDLENEVARLYANVFSKEELEEIKAFYESPAGKKLLKESPVLIREIATASRTWTAGVDRDLRQEIAKKMQELTATTQTQEGATGEGN